MHCEHEHHEQNHEKSGAREDAWQDANHHSRPSQVKSNAAMPPALENDPEDLVVKEEACGAFHGAEAAAEPAAAAAEEVAHGGGDEGQARASGEGDRLLLATGRSESAGPAEGANHAECQGQGGVFHEDRKRLQLLQALAHSDRQLFLREQEDTTEHARAHAHTHTPSEREGVSKRATRAGGGDREEGEERLGCGVDERECGCVEVEGGGTSEHSGEGAACKKTPAIASIQDACEACNASAMAVDDAAQGAAGPAAMNPAQPAGAGNSPALTDALKTAITALTHNIAKEDKEKLKEKWYNYTQKKSADAPSQVTFASSLCSVPLAGTFHGD